MVQDPDRTPVAKDVFTYCTKEKTETWHVVRNHNAQGIVERVVCKACGSEHRYRLASKTAAPRPASSRAVLVRTNGVARAPSAAPAATSSAALEDTWFKGIKKWGDKTVRPFEPTQFFDLNEVFEHVVFGKGVVQSRRENKIDVLFKSGMKTLPSARK